MHRCRRPCTGEARVAMPNFLAYAALAIGLLTPVYLAVLLFVLA